MTTKDRPHFVAQALRCFSRQTYRDAELVLVDAGEHALVEDLCAGMENVRYVREEPGANYGLCLNRAAQESRGEVLQLQDDDDYYAPGFLERTAQAWADNDSVNTIAAWDCFHILVTDQEYLRYSGHGWGAGGTLSFRRPLWERVQFRNEGAYQDWLLKEDSGATANTFCAPELYMLVRHGGNSWRNIGGQSVDDHFRSRPPTALRVEDFVHADDREFYEELRRRCA